MVPSTPESGSTPIVSRFAGDPEMADLVGFFLDELPGRVEALKTAWSNREVRLLTRLAHQLRGAGAGYGYPQIRDAAGHVEDSLRSTGLEGVEASFRELVDLCSRACMGR